MCGDVDGWVERETQYGAWKGEMESLKADQTVGGGKNVPEPSQWLHHYRCAQRNSLCGAWGNCTGKSEGKEEDRKRRRVEVKSMSD